MDKLSFKEMKKKFENWQKNPSIITYPESEIMVEPYHGKYRISKVIRKSGKLATDCKYITTFKHFSVLDKWRNAGYTIGYVIASFPLSK